MLKKQYDIKKLRYLESLGYIKGTKHSKYDLILWKYTKECQYEKYWTEYTIACRSLVTDSEGNVISPCIPRFNNLEENKHTPTESFTITEKMDGQLVYMFVYNGELIIRSSGLFDSTVTENVRKHFEEKLKNTGFWGHLTYCFELTGKCAKIVVDYPYEAKLTLLTIIDNSTFEEPSDPKLLGFESVERYYFDSYTDLKKKDLPNKEGYIIKFDNGQRCKIKFDNYIQKHFFNFSLSTKLVWRHLKEGTLDILIEDLPDESHVLIDRCGFKLLLDFERVRRVLEHNLSVVKTIDFDSRKDLVEFIKDKMSHPNLTLALYDRKVISDEIYRLIEPEFKIL